MSGGLITQANEAQLGSLLMGVGSPKGTNFLVHQIDGLGMPDLQTHDKDRPLGDGERAGSDFLRARTINLTLSIVDTKDGAPLDMARARDDLLAELAPMKSGLREFSWRLVGYATRTAFVRPRRFEDVIDMLWRKQLIREVPIQLWAPDPRLYSATEESPEPTITIASGNTSAQLTMDNDGNFETPPVIEIGGPARNPVLTHNGLGRGIRMSIDIQSGETLEIDVYEKTVRLDGVNAFSAVRSDNQWWQLQPGSNTITYSRSSTALTGADSSAVFNYRHAWWS